MAVHTCTRCGQVRAKLGEDICPVCWLVAELAREHTAGDHAQLLNVSCVACTRPLGKQRSRALTAVPLGPMPERRGHVRCYQQGLHEATRAGRAWCRRQVAGG